MAFDGIVTKYIVEELKLSLIGAKVNKVFEPTKNDIVFSLYNNGKNYALNICIEQNNYRMHLTTTTKPNPISAPNFCMLLRKHLIGSRVVNINNYDLERVIEITFEGYNELNDKTQKKIIVELMNRYSNVILVNENGNIIDSLRHVDSINRVILPARHYEYPVNNKSSFLELSSFNEFIEVIENNPTVLIDKKLSDSFIGISRPFIQNILRNLNISNETKSLDDLQKIYMYIKNITNLENIDKVSCIPINENKDFIIDFSEYSNNASTPLKINFFVDDFYFAKEEKDNFLNYRNSLLKIILTHLKKCSKRLENINAKLEECKNMNTYRLYGELLTANLYKLANGLKSVTIINYYDNLPLEIPLDNSISVQKNAEKYFKKYTKLKHTLEIVSKQKSSTIKELKYIESIIYSLETSNNMLDLEEIYFEIYDNLDIKQKNNNKQKKSPETNSPKEYLINGFTVIVGKNNRQNDIITKKANSEDLWFHTQKIHGSHVILKTGGKSVDENTIYQCAKLAMKNSKAKNSSNVPVDYTLAKYVKKPNGSKPGMVIYTNQKTIFV